MVLWVRNMLDGTVCGIYRWFDFSVQKKSHKRIFARGFYEVGYDLVTGSAILYL
jgi:hypothetical protein